MLIARMTFGTARSMPGIDLVDAAESYLAALLRNGQIDEYLLSLTPRSIEAFIELPRPNAVSVKFLSTSGRRELRHVRTAFGRTPSSVLVRRPVRRRWPSWRSADALYLFTHAFDRHSPVRAFNSTEPIPLYTLPISDRLREEIRSRALEYRDLHRIWFGSGALEMAAYKQLADPSSQLSHWGRDLSTALGRATHRRTYYYMTRYYGRRRNDDARLCPSCGREWRVTRHNAKATKFARFEFRCHRCRLVSHTASSSDGGRHAKIGEFHHAERSTP